MSELVKLVARATRADLYDEQAAPENQSQTMQNYYAVIVAKHEGLVSAALMAVMSAGYTIVPREPTLAMRKVCSFETAEIEWPAMLAAAQIP